MIFFYNLFFQTYFSLQVAKQNLHRYPKIRDLSSAVWLLWSFRGWLRIESRVFQVTSVPGCFSIVTFPLILLPTKLASPFNFQIPTSFFQHNTASEQNYTLKAFFKNNFFEFLILTLLRKQEYQKKLHTKICAGRKRCLFSFWDVQYIFALEKPIWYDKTSGWKIFGKMPGCASERKKIRKDFWNGWEAENMADTLGGAINSVIMLRTAIVGLEKWAQPENYGSIYVSVENLKLYESKEKQRSLQPDKIAMCMLRTRERKKRKMKMPIVLECKQILECWALTFHFKLTSLAQNICFVSYFIILILYTKHY